MESEESFFSSDHLSLSHVRQVYSGIRILEHRIVSILYSRMQSDPCFSSALHRYDDMASRLGGNKTEKEEAAKEKIRDRLQHNDMPIQESFVNATYWRNIRRWRSTLHKLYEGTSFYTDENALCDGCFSDIPIKSFKPNPTYYNHFQLRKWVGDEEVFDISTSDNRHVMFSYSWLAWYPSPSTPIDITAIAAATYNRLFSLQQLLYRWRGFCLWVLMTISPLCVVLQCPREEESFVLRFINHHHFPSRFTLIIFLSEPPHKYYVDFPVNYLRNLAIQNIRTTHFLITDMDLRLSGVQQVVGWQVVNAYDEFMRIPRFLLESYHSAVILPIFFYNHTVILNYCDSIEQCDELWVPSESLMCSTSYYQPENKAELVACMQQSLCFSNKRLLRTHVEVMWVCNVDVFDAWVVYHSGQFNCV